MPEVAAGERIYALVMATRHESVPRGADARVMVDGDLAILGAPESRFEEYEIQVREEYAFVPDSEYRLGRQAILQRFLSGAREPRARAR